MKRFLLLPLALLLAVAAIADTYPYLTFQTADGATTSVSSEGLSMSFSENGKNIVITNGTVSRTFSVTDLTKMFFSTSDLSGVDEVTRPTGTGEIQVYSASGVSFGKFSSQQSLNGILPPGIYIVKSNGETHKIAVK